MLQHTQPCGAARVPCSTLLLASTLLLLLLLLLLLPWQAVLDYMRSCPEQTRDQFLYISSNVYWMGAYVLATLLVTEGGWRSWRAGMGWGGVGLKWAVLSCKGHKGEKLKEGTRRRQGVDMLCCAEQRAVLRLCDVMLCRAAKGKSVRAEGAAVTADDGWAADGLDLVKSTPHHINSYNSAKGEPGGWAGGWGRSLCGVSET